MAMTSTAWPIEDLFVAPPRRGHGPGAALATLQGAEHSRMRRIYSQAFNGPALRRYEQDIVVPAAQSLVGSLQERGAGSDAAGGSGEVDLVEDFAIALPRLVLAELLEVPVDEIIRYDGHIMTILAGIVGVADPVAQAAARVAHAELLELIRTVVDQTSPTPTPWPGCATTSRWPRRP